jgi:hypothetical protein
MRGDILKAVSIAGAVLALVILLLVAFVLTPDGRSTLLVVNQGARALSRVTLLGSDGSRQELNPVNAADSARYELKGLREAYFSVEVTRSDGSEFRTPVGRMVSDNFGIDDTIFVSDSAFIVTPARTEPHGKRVN